MSDKIKELNADIEELQSLFKQATRQKVKDLLAIDIRKMETIVISLKETEDKKQKESGDTKTAEPKPRTTDSLPVVRMRDYGWDQSDKFVKFYLTMPGVQDLDENAVTLTTTPSSLSLQACFPDKTQIFSVDHLLKEISTDKSYHKVKSDRVVIFLKKAKENEKWTFVTMTEQQIKDASEAKKMERMTDDISSDDPSAGIMNIMKRIYQDGDDNTKRGIAQAWMKAQDQRSTMNMEEDSL
ncbi:calcyclin-binding protein-like [Tropilaelaps mercedesae]|uniref:Calcyclin-binding protein n=1 Tax=Tropilaelaps mercedesae TaxID=418985 RepID=A0A1V9XQM7_9ACAR|nr:calcyclin-binding protein-like [Tropilaelaps mercedesae]